MIMYMRCLQKPSNYTVMLLLPACLMVGCSNNTLSWSSNPEAARQIDAARRIGVISRVSLLEGMPIMGDSGQAEIANAIVGELTARGYRVTNLREQAYHSPEVNRRETLTARAEPEPVATIEREASSSGADMTSRYRAARDANVDLLMEFSTQVSQEMRMRMSVSTIPFIPTRATTTWSQEIQHMSLTVSDPEEQVVLATITVSYDPAQKDIRKATKDALKGLDMVRQGQASATIKLEGN